MLGLRSIYQRLFAAYGPQGWWPADDPFEIAVGAVLTQNTAWRNVERAMEGLRSAGLLLPAALQSAPIEHLASVLRPSGYFNVKARRLLALAQTWLDGGGAAGLARLSTESLRERLLATHGVGRETADDIVLYAFSRPRFVIDAYTRRILGRLGDESAVGMPYDTLQKRFAAALGDDVRAYNEYHALLVKLGKDVCQPRPRCGECPLVAGCELGRRKQSPG